MGEDAGDKRFPASPWKRQRAREQGQVARSQDLVSAVALLVALFGLRFLGPRMMSQLVDVMRHYVGDSDTLIGELGSSRYLVIQALWLTAPIILPFMLLMMVTGLTANILQVGFLLSGKPITPKIEKLNPFTGLSNMFNVRSLAELVKSVLKVSLAGYVVWLSLRGRLDEVIQLVLLSPESLVPSVGGLMFTLWWRLALLLLVIGLLDYAFQWWQHERTLMMTLKEVQDEMKEFEGDPKIKQRIRAIQRQLATQRMMAEVPKADVIITNPTRYAVALRYDSATMRAPVVVAKGARILAERIREAAVANDVPIVQKPDLARTLYRTIEIGQPVPENLFRAVAEVLAYVYRIDRRVEKISERTRAWEQSPQAA